MCVCVCGFLLLKFPSDSCTLFEIDEQWSRNKYNFGVSLQNIISCQSENSNFFIILTSFWFRNNFSVSPSLSHSFPTTTKQASRIKSHLSASHFDVVLMHTSQGRCFVCRKRRVEKIYGNVAFKRSSGNVLNKSIACNRSNDSWIFECTLAKLYVLLKILFVFCLWSKLFFV